jgi:hypothetical protein
MVKLGRCTMYQVTGDVTAHYSTISLARSGFSHVLTLSGLKVMFMTFNITIPNPNPNPNQNNGTLYIVHTPEITLCAHLKL